MKPHFPLTLELPKQKASAFSVPGRELKCVAKIAKSKTYMKNNGKNNFETFFHVLKVNCHKKFPWEFGRRRFRKV
jgi:hypothetical protein